MWKLIRPYKKYSLSQKPARIGMITARQCVGLRVGTKNKNKYKQIAGALWLTRSLNHLERICVYYKRKFIFLNM